MKIAITIIALVAFVAVLGFIASQRLPKDFTLPMPTTKEAAQSDLPELGRMPEFVGIASWLNSEPLTKVDLRGTVVLIDFWTYSCINCIRTLPYVTGWYEKYKDRGFIIVGIHTPEFAFEKNRDNVAGAIDRYNITYPVAQDNEYATWNAYANRYWPAHYLFDTQGNLRYTHFGEGEYDTTENNIQSLLAEAGQSVTSDTIEGPSVPDFRQIQTPETYLGYERGTLLGSPESVVRNDVQQYTSVAAPALNLFYLSGNWRVEAERTVAEETGVAIVYRYHASTVNLVMSPPESSNAKIRLTLDGQAVPANLRGSDVVEENGQTYVTIDDERLYHLIDAQGDYAEHVLKLEFETAGCAAYAFTFG